MSTLKYGVAFGTLIFGISACAPKVDEQSSSGKYLYAVSGGCYVGSATASSAAKTIVRYNLSTGNIDRTIIDYNAIAGDTPVAAINSDDSNILVLVENTAGRRVDSVNKLTGVRTTLTTLVGTTTVARDLVALKNGGYLVPRSAAMEKYNSAFARVFSNAANPWMNGPGGTCATSTTTVSRAVELANGKVIFSHGTASQNRFGILPATMATQADCLQGQASPIIASAFPTAMTYIPDAGGAGIGHLLVAYASATGATVASNLIGQYAITESSNVITPSAATNAAAFADTSIINGPSAMVYDSDSGYLYVANGSTNLANTIEKFTYNASTKLLTRVGTSSFAPETINSRCINSMFLAN
ncbi:hypothetical protein [Bdellovibrio svalbardensis]|uniref:Cell surface protein n=1 Tax=Bdellovibrio svalbardensis TaxID=2972972 RepID=A0ABT6DKR9_9BACT|nr:hypothetical protein [Bdellovibrio svalbardensis]MDG0817149.1 hypothetical protein [Bdellovibrio svalbardensis]